MLNLSADEQSCYLNKSDTQKIGNKNLLGAQNNVRLCRRLGPSNKILHTQRLSFPSCSSDTNISVAVISLLDRASVHCPPPSPVKSTWRTPLSQCAAKREKIQYTVLGRHLGSTTAYDECNGRAYLLLSSKSRTCSCRMTTIFFLSHHVDN